LVCPANAVIDVTTVHGNLQVGGIAQAVTLGTVNGNARVTGVAAVNVQDVGGNLTIRDVRDDVRAGAVRGNLRVYLLGGNVAADRVAGNAWVEDTEGDVEIGRVSGNAHLSPMPGRAATLHATVSGNVTVLLDSASGVQVLALASGGVRSDVDGLALVEEGGLFRGVRDDGAMILQLSAGGWIRLRQRVVRGLGADRSHTGLVDLEPIGEMIEAQISESMADMESRLAELLGSIGVHEVSRRLSEVQAALLQQATESSHETVRLQAQREAERARMRAERERRKWRRVSGHLGVRHESGATDEERLRVLRMVEEGRITPQEATELLAALEGR